MNNKIYILGVRIDILTMQEVLERVKDFLDASTQVQIATINAEFIIAAQKEERFRNILNYCAINTADGIGPIWAAKYLEKKINNDSQQSLFPNQ